MRLIVVYQNRESKVNEERTIPMMEGILQVKYIAPEFSEDEREEYPGEHREYIRQKTVEAAIDAIYRILDLGGNNSIAEADYLLSAFAVNVIGSIHARNQSRLRLAEIAGRVCKEVKTK